MFWTRGGVASKCLRISTKCWTILNKCLQIYPKNTPKSTKNTQKPPFFVHFSAIFAYMGIYGVFFLKIRRIFRELWYFVLISPLTTQILPQNTSISSQNKLPTTCTPKHISNHTCSFNYHHYHQLQSCQLNQNSSSRQYLNLIFSNCFINSFQSYPLLACPNEDQISTPPPDAQPELELDSHTQRQNSMIRNCNINIVDDVRFKYYHHLQFDKWFD